MRQQLSLDIEHLRRTNDFIQFLLIIQNECINLSIGRFIIDVLILIDCKYQNPSHEGNMLNLLGFG